MERLREISTMTAWQQAVEASAQGPVLLLKHSTRCPISSRAFEEFQGFCEGSDLPCYFVKVIENRNVSNAIAQETGIPHESPQLHLILNGASVWQTSHRAITQERILDALAGSAAL